MLLNTLLFAAVASAGFAQDGGVVNGLGGTNMVNEAMEFAKRAPEPSQQAPAPQQKCMYKMVKNSSLRGGQACQGGCTTVNNIWCRSGICKESLEECRNDCWRKHVHNDGVRTTWKDCSIFWSIWAYSRCTEAHKGIKDAKIRDQQLRECQVKAEIGTFYCTVEKKLKLNEPDHPGLLTLMKKDKPTCIKACDDAAKSWINPQTHIHHYNYSRFACHYSCNNRYSTGEKKPQKWDHCETLHRQTRNACFKYHAGTDALRRCEAVFMVGMTHCYSSPRLI